MANAYIEQREYNELLSTIESIMKMLNKLIIYRKEFNKNIPNA